jgi:hypothetical protein
MQVSSLQERAQVFLLLSTQNSRRWTLRRSRTSFDNSTFWCSTSQERTCSLTGKASPPLGPSRKRFLCKVKRFWFSSVACINFFNCYSCGMPGSSMKAKLTWIRISRGPTGSYDQREQASDHQWTRLPDGPYEFGFSNSI